MSKLIPISFLTMLLSAAAASANTVGGDATGAFLAAFAAAMIAIIIVGIAAYIYVSIALMTIAKKQTLQTDGWLSYQ
ncbi:hypothetical protein HYX10_05885 [Candidatus Woesearchaeota archaeon]|nr:hypothetical protein [Candidatus Woesearchaeota archaeon]